jgi:phosphoribosylaminoimidazole carboxylase PurK protein
MSEKKNVIGIIGGGQLGRMLVEAAHKLGFLVVVLCDSEDSPAALVADRTVIGSFKDGEAIKKVAELSDFLTFEIEGADADTLNELVASGVKVNPAPSVLALIKDKFEQKTFLRKNNIPVADFMRVDSLEDMAAAGETLGYPFVLKSRFDGYDGRGNRTVKNSADCEQAFSELSKFGALYAEAFVPFVKELAVVGVRDMAGNVMTYPVVETIHKNHICHMVIAPALVIDTISHPAAFLGERVLSLIGGVGVMAVEMFLTESGDVLVNEIAPRVHNSGHYTIECSQTSQFENHIRAVTGMELGETWKLTPLCVMVNILGTRNGKAQPEGVEEAEALGNVFVHIYGKMETRVERKMGHITVIASNVYENVINKAEEALNLITL